MLGSLYPVRDVRLCGHVIYTGKSSMEIAVKMEAVEGDGSEETLLLGMMLFSMLRLQTSPLHDFFRTVFNGMQRCYFS